MTRTQTPGKIPPPPARTRQPRAHRNTRLGKNMQERVAAATLPIGRRSGHGQCVLVEGGRILTAAHCLHYPHENSVSYFFTGLAMGDRLTNKVYGDKGLLLAEVLSFDPISDIAALGSYDSYKEQIAFDDFLDRVQPVKLLRDRPEPFKAFPVWILTNTKQWVDGMATYYSGRGFAFETKTEIPSGTSGGPIVNKRGELVGVVSHGATSPAKTGLYTSSAPLMPLALPAWLLSSI